MITKEKFFQLEQKRKSAAREAMLTGLLLGILVGLVVGLLFAPKPGAELFAELKDKCKGMFGGCCEDVDELDFDEE